MKAAVLGSPVGHSLSPVLHRAAYRALGLAGWSYQAIECDGPALAGVIAACGPDWAGLSLTMPLKHEVLPLLDQVEPRAADAGAANTVVFRDGARDGYNTDIPGMIAALAEAAGPTGAAPAAGGTPAGGTPAGGTPAGGTPAGPGEVLILGGGATARSALTAVAELGGESATVAIRDPARAGDLLNTAERLGVAVRLTRFGEPTGTDPALLISTVPAGAADSYAKLIATRELAPSRVLDVIYHPWPTPLALAARDAGAAVAGGFDLLLHQAARQVELMTGRPAPVPEMRAAGLAAMPT